jgi:hypothetical protein
MSRGRVVELSIAAMFMLIGLGLVAADQLALGPVLLVIAISIGIDFLTQRRRRKHLTSSGEPR